MRLRKQLRFLAMALISLLIGACAQSPKLDKDIDSLPRYVALDEVPFFPQADYQCGPAALATTLVHRGVKVTPDELVPKVYLPSRQGSLQLEMVAAARSYESLVYPLEPKLSALFKEVAAGNPVLILQNLSLKIMPMWHFAVVVGYDLDKERVLMRSGTEKEQWLELKAFDKTWARGERWAIVTMAPDTLPATARPEVWLQAASDLEQVGKTQAAATAYQTATTHWPNEGHAWFAYANQQYAKGDKQAAAVSMRRAIEVTPTLAPAWYNFAWINAEAGCHSAAQIAQRCAQQLAPEDARFTKALPKAGSQSCEAAPSCPALTK